MIPCCTQRDEEIIEEDVNSIHCTEYVCSDCAQLFINRLESFEMLVNYLLCCIVKVKMLVLYIFLVQNSSSLNTEFNSWAQTHSSRVIHAQFQSHTRSVLDSHLLNSKLIPVTYNYIESHNFLPSLASLVEEG